MKTLGTLMVFAGLAVKALATAPTPEIDAGSAFAALALVSGGLLVIRSRRK